MFHPTSRMHGVATTTKGVGWLYVVQGLALGGWAVAKAAHGDPAAADVWSAGAIALAGVLAILAGWRIDRGDLWAYFLAVPIVGVLAGVETLFTVLNMPLLARVPILGVRLGLVLIFLPMVGFANALYALSDVRDAYRARRRERAMYVRRGFEPIVSSAADSQAAKPVMRLPPRPKMR